MASKTVQKAIPSRAPYKNWPNDAAFEASTTSPIPKELRITGKFPLSLAGTLYRTGPAHYKLDTPSGQYARSHWFDGFSQIHRFEIIPDKEKGCCRVVYTSRSQVDELLEEGRKGGNMDKYITFGQKRDPCMSFFEKVKATFLPADATKESDHPGLSNVGVTVRPNMPGLPGGTITALSDSNQIQYLDLETLEPVGVTTQKGLHPELKGPMSCAHAGYDAETGDLFNFNLDFGRSPTYRIFRTSAKTSKTEIIATINSGVKAAYIHSFFLSKDFVVLCIWPLYFTGHGASVLWERNIIDALKFDPDAQAKWLVIDRHRGRGLVATFASPAFFSFHTVNAFQEENDDGSVDIYCDVVQFADDAVLRHLYYENVLSTGQGAPVYNAGRPSLVRYKLSAVPREGRKKGTAAATVISNIAGAGELPTINPGYATRRQRYVYGIVDRGLSSFVDGIAKTDIETGQVTCWGREPKPHTPGEAIFVSDGTGDGEDAGYLLSVVLDGETDTSYLVCLSARDMTEVARAECDHAIGMGLHGVHCT
ncbi:carotenoid oxygenase [Aspergillus nidulans var. acristatus]